MKKIFFIIASVLITALGYSQLMTAEQYVQMNKDFAIREMKRMGVPAAITLAQGLLETENGNSDLLKKSNNHFGIKCKDSWTAEGVSHDDDALGECFRSYKNAESSYRDHSNFLRGNSRYAFLFKLDPKDYRGWAYGLKKAGYATNPRYPQILIKNIEDNNLEQYTLLAVDKVPIFDASKYTDDPEEKTSDNTTDSKPLPDDKSITNVTSATGDKEPKIIVNGSKAVYCLKGKSLLAIATENNINLAKLLEYNDLEKDGLLDKDQNIFLEKKAKECDDNFYLAQQNESVYDISQKKGIQLQSLLAYNKLNQNNIISTGTKLQLKEKIPETLLVNMEKDNKTDTTYKVQAGEGLYGISKKLGVSVLQLKEWNNLIDDNLKVGQLLIISK